jgi:colanic acid biosynthesis glycosyl transferase WcaI
MIRYNGEVNVLIVSSNYFPEPLGIGLYSYDLATLLMEQGHHVWVLTTFPYYPWWNTPKDMESFAVKYSMIDGVHVHRAKVQLSKSISTYGRALFVFRMWVELRNVSKHYE